MGTVLMRVRARDRDIGDNGRIIYEFSQHTAEQYGHMFGIKAETGKIYIKNNLDFEVTFSHTVYTHRWRFGAVGSDVGQINEVTLRRARLVPGWMTVSGFNSCCGKFISV